MVLTLELGSGMTLGEVIAALAFAGTIIYQSVMLKANIQLLIERVSKIETDLKELTSIFINQAELKTTVDGLVARMKTIEERCWQQKHCAPTTEQ